MRNAASRNPVLQAAPDIVVLTGFFALARICDYAIAGSVFLFYYVFYLVVPGAFVAVRWFRFHLRVSVGLFCLYAFLLVAWPLLDPAFPARYKRFYREITIGMKTQEVQRLFEKRFPAYLSEGRPTIRVDEDGFSFAQDPSDADYNAELIHIGVSNGVVTGKAFLPD